ncbi:MAG: hypothetical protein CXZ00_06355 [Acidobacteria bacterium]|nr:MAG: hypothetical protein CXZ00_06355 [Acidobacteriota bacterium]
MDNYRADVAHIGKSVIIKGELSGSEDLYLDGEVEGSIDLKKNNLAIGPNGRVRANVYAREVVIHGQVNGNVTAVDKIDLKKSAQLIGDIKAQRIAIEDGAFFKGSVDICKGEPKAEAVGQAAHAVAAATPAPSVPAAAAPPLIEKK